MSLNGVVNTNTYISLGVIVTIIGGLFQLNTTINTSKADIVSRLDRMEMRVNNLETHKDAWTDLDMLRWTIHLKDSNPQIKIPEPAK